MKSFIAIVVCLIAFGGVTIVNGSTNQEVVKTLNEAQQEVEQAQKGTDKLEGQIKEAPLPQSLIEGVEKWAYQAQDLVSFIKMSELLHDYGKEPLSAKLKKDQKMLIETMLKLQKKVNEEGLIDIKLLNKNVKQIKKFKKRLSKFVAGRGI